MNTNTTLFWHVTFVLLTVIVGVAAACQITAEALGYSARLGEPWFIFADTPIYEPWRFFGWWFSYEAYAPEIFKRGGLIAASSGFAAIFVAVTGSIIRARGAKHVTTYGSSRWATPRDIRKSGILKSEGVFLGQIKGQYLRHEGPEHIMAFAPTRSGKGVGLVVPTLLSWTHSAVIHDIKGENWALTSGWRSTFSRALRFDPTSIETVRFNPLAEVRPGPTEVRDVQNIADILIDPEGTPDKRNHWDKTAYALLAGSILHILYAEENKTLAGVAEFLSHPHRDIEDTLDLMMNTNHFGTETNPKVHPTIASYAREILDKKENERSGVISTALTCLQLYRDPIAAAATSVSDFSIDDLVRGDKPISLYLTIPPSDISRTKPLIRLMLNQIGRRLTEDMDGLQDRRQVLFMLDEFPALGRLDFFETALGYMAGYGLRAYLITQSLNQIDKAYGPHNAILDHCHVRVAFASNDERTAKRISDALGTTTEQRAMKNYAGHRLAPWLSHVMVSRQETARALLTPGEVMQLPSDQELILLSGKRPIKAEKIRYFEDRNFTERRLDPPEDAGYGRDLPPGLWDGRRANIHTQLILEHAHYKQELAARKSAGKAKKPTRKRKSELELDDTLTPESDEKDIAQEEERDAGPEAIQKSFGFDEANDVGMLGRGSSSDDDDDGGRER